MHKNFAFVVPTNALVPGTFEETYKRGYRPSSTFFKFDYNQLMVSTSIVEDSNSLTFSQVNLEDFKRPSLDKELYSSHLIKANVLYGYTEYGLTKLPYYIGEGVYVQGRIFNVVKTVQHEINEQCLVHFTGISEDIINELKESLPDGTYYTYDFNENGYHACIEKAIIELLK